MPKRISEVCPCLLHVCVIFFLKRYNQTCSNNHLYKMTTCLRCPMLNLPKQIPMQLLLFNMAICLIRPVTTFFCLPNEKKTCLKQPLQNCNQQRNGEQTRRQCIKNKNLSDYIYSIATL